MKLTEQELIQRLQNLKHGDQKKISIKTGLTEMTLINFKKGKHRISYPSFIKLQKYFIKNK